MNQQDVFKYYSYKIEYFKIDIVYNFFVSDWNTWYGIKKTILRNK